MKTEKTSKHEWVDSMAQAAGVLGEPLSVIQAAKDAGCKAFKGSRVDLIPLREWIAANGERVKRAAQSAEADHRATIADAELREEKLLRIRKESVRISEARRRVVGCLIKLKSRILAIPSRVSQKLSLQTDPLKVEESLNFEINDAFKQTRTDDYASYDCPHCGKRIGD